MGNRSERMMRASVIHRRRSSLRRRHRQCSPTRCTTHRLVVLRGLVVVTGTFAARRKTSTADQGLDLGRDRGGGEQAIRNRRGIGALRGPPGRVVEVIAQQRRDGGRVVWES